MQANQKAKEIASIINLIRNLSLSYPVETNQIFFTAPPSWILLIQERIFCYPWDQEKNEVRFIASWNTTESDKDSFRFSLPLPTCSESRFGFDIKLVNRAIKKGARIITNAKVVNIEEDNVLLDNSERLYYTDLIVSTGRLVGSTTPMFYGFKGHFEGINLQNGQPND